MRVSTRVVAVALSAAVVVAACGGGGGGKTSTGTGSTSVGSAGTVGTPKLGGNLVMGTEAEIDGFDPTSDRWDTTGYMYAFSVYDPLTALGQDGQFHPYLAQSVTHSPDYKTWTITLRPNIKFSNGDPLTGQDVAEDLTAIKDAPLTGHVYDPVTSFTATGPLTVTVACNVPWVAFPAYLSGQAGTVFDPIMLKDPNRAQHPIGTGPFILKEWIPGNHFIATRNPNYWQKGLPYLNSVEFRPIVDEQSRESSLQSGSIQLFHSSDPQATYDLKGHSGINIINESAAPGQQSQDFIMLNTAKPPLNDVTLRQALAYATNAQSIINVINYGLTPQSDGPFSNPGSIYHTATGYPTYNLAKAKQLVQQYEKAHNVTSVSFQLGATNSGRDLQEAELIQQQWKAAGINTSIVQVEQSQYILYALEGNYNAYLWRQFGDVDPDEDYIWWAQTTAAPVGQYALNFARNKDPQIQTDLDTGRSATTQAARVAAYEDIAHRFAIDVPYLWINQTLWQIVSDNDIHGIVGGTLPDGSAAADHTVGGVFFTSRVWIG
jgi:peptide/nickel transport system substrate-binding protein